MKKYFFVLLSFSILAVPALAFAADPLGGPVIVTCAGFGTGFEGVCQACDLAQLAQKVINFAVAFSAFVATLMFLYAGILYFTAAADSKQVEKAHGIFSKVFIGFVIILTAWLIVNIILNTLTNRGLADWSNIQCGHIETPVGPALAQPGSIDPVTNQPVKPGNPIADDTAARSQLNPGISSKDGVSYQGVQQSTVNGLNTLHNDCKCDFTVTSATDGDHSGGTFSHANGYKADIRPSTELDSYIKNNFTPAGTRSDGSALYQDSHGNTYAREGDHWDVLYK